MVDQPTIIAIHKSMSQAMLKTMKNITVVYFESNSFTIVVLQIVTSASNIY